MNDLRIFVAGGMRGWPNYNWEAFDDTKSQLHLMGFGDVVTPADIDRRNGVDPDVDMSPVALRECLKASVCAMLDCDCVVITRGWKKSLGTGGEIAHARAAGMPVFKISCDGLVELDPDEPEEDLLLEALEITTRQRQTAYGHPNKDFTKVAALWTVTFDDLLRHGKSFRPSDVALALLQLKISRESHAYKVDNWRDLAGYARCGQMVAMAARDGRSTWHPERLRSLSNWRTESQAGCSSPPPATEPTR